MHLAPENVGPLVELGQGIGRFCDGTNSSCPSEGGALLSSLDPILLMYEYSVPSNPLMSGRRRPGPCVPVHGHPPCSRLLSVGDWCCWRQRWVRASCIPGHSHGRVHHRMPSAHAVAPCHAQRPRRICAGVAGGLETPIVRFETICNSVVANVRPPTVCLCLCSHAAHLVAHFATQRERGAGNALRRRRRLAALAAMEIERHQTLG